MIINGKILSEDDLVAPVSSFKKMYNNICITDAQVEILKKYGIIVDNYSNINELMYDIEEYLNNSSIYLGDLDWVSQELSEYNYYNNVNK